jgi:hypothetical protein
MDQRQGRARHPNDEREVRTDAEWPLKGAPARKGEPLRDEFEETVRQLAVEIGCAPGGVKVMLQTVNGAPWRDAEGEKWADIVRAEARAIGFI